MRIDLHNHTNLSPDSLMSPKTLIKYAIKKNITALAITDHESTNNIKAAKYYGANKLLIIPGFELKTNIGDILGVFIDRIPNSKDIYDVIDFIKSENGLSIMPHPFNASSRNSRKNNDFIKYIDLIEAFNGRTLLQDNIKALKLAKKYNKPITAGSDAHVKVNVGTTYQILEQTVNNLDDLRDYLIKGINKVNFQYTDWYWLNYSQLIKNIKRGHLVKRNIGLAHNSLIHLKNSFLETIK